LADNLVLEAFSIHQLHTSHWCTYRGIRTHAVLAVLNCWCLQAKTTKKIVLRLVCNVCKVAHMHALKVCDHLELTSSSVLIYPTCTGSNQISICSDASISRSEETRSRRGKHIRSSRAVSVAFVWAVDVELVFKGTFLDKQGHSAAARHDARIAARTPTKPRVFHFVIIEGR
jgi:hypothetical protein